MSPPSNAVELITNWVQQAAKSRFTHSFISPAWGVLRSPIRGMSLLVTVHTASSCTVRPEGNTARLLHPLGLESLFLHSHSLKPEVIPLVRLIPARPKSEGNRAPSGLGPYLYCQQLGRKKIIRFLDCVPNMKQGTVSQ